MGAAEEALRTLSTPGMRPEPPAAPLSVDGAVPVFILVGRNAFLKLVESF